MASVASTSVASPVVAGHCATRSRPGRRAGPLGRDGGGDHRRRTERWRRRPAAAHRAVRRCRPRRPPGARGRRSRPPSRRVPADLQDALDVAHDRILAYHAHESGGPRSRTSSPVGSGPPSRAAGRPGPAATRPVAGPGTLDRADVRRARPGGRGGGDRPVRPARARRPDRRRHPGRRRGRRGRRGLPGRAGPRPSRPWPTAPRSIEPVDVIVGPGQPLRGRGQAPGVRGGGRGLGVRRALRGGGDRRPRAPRPSWPPSTSWSRPSTGPTGWPGW